ncbi:MAG: tRNA lysidine(34) synthetase TilS [Clostridia bacterium]|nr:tRNA lysidine(34) synthetase TilS [Clostridia bacterium]
MEKILDFIIENKFFSSGSVVGVGVSGGSDSMALLHFLNANKFKLDIDVVAINVIHGTREADEAEAIFVEDYCRENRIRFYKFRVEAGILAKQKGMGLEEACRETRYGVFESLKKRGLVDYVCLAHHQRDQAETILMHILRGSGIKGASGMEYVRDNFYVRPLLDMPKDELMRYVYENDIQYLEDETNSDNTITRNMIRNVVMPELRKVWQNVDATLCNFGKTCKEDDQVIRSMINFDAVLYNDDMVKVPLTYFVYGNSHIFRLLDDCLAKLGVIQNFERKHLIMILDLAKSGENGAKINLPNNVDVYKEYEYITITHKKPKVELNVEWDFKIGTIKFGDYGKLSVKRAKSPELQAGFLLVDLDQIPNGAVWRVRKEGDYIEKFGGGSRKLKSYLNDKKVPARIRDYLPVLALGNEVLAVAGVDISEHLKVTESTKNFGLIKYDMQNWV